MYDIYYWGKEKKLKNKQYRVGLTNHKIYMPDNIITLNVGGTPVQTQKETLIMSGYFRGIFEATDVSQPIFVDYSPVLFDMMLSFLRDPKYLFPMECHFVLDFFDVSYEKELLYNDTYQICTDCGKCYKLINAVVENYCNNCYKCQRSGCSNAKIDVMFCKDHRVMPALAPSNKIKWLQHI